MKICLLQGGTSSEREISLISSKAITKAINELNYDLIIIDPQDYPHPEDFIKAIKSTECDLVFIGLHGGDGENGIIQALLHSAKIKFTGSDYKSSAIAMDKYLSASIAKIHDINVPKQHLLNAIPENLKQLIEYLNFPIVVKPNTSGSSVGIHIIENSDELIPAMQDAFKYDQLIILQEFINGREITVTILDKKALPIVEIKPKTGFYDYKNKYTKGHTEYICPAELNDSQTGLVQMYAQKIFNTIGCNVYARVDFRFDGKNFYFLEINTLPGMTELSLSPMAAQKVGINFNQFINEIIKLSI